MLKAPALAVLVLVPIAVPVTAQDFWKHWGDGKAELDGYSLKQPRYGTLRDGRAVVVFVTEDFSDSLRVKADPGKHPSSDVYPVLKVNVVRAFQTGIYDYRVMTSTFLRVAPGWPVVKVSFSSQEWCGQVWHQIVPRAGRLAGLFHSYFDGEADGTDDLPLPKDGLMEDALPMLLRAWNGEYLRAGESRTVPFLPSLLWTRLNHRPLAWTKATVARSAGVVAASVPAGRFRSTTYTVEIDGGRTLGFEIEAAPPYRLVRQTGPAGEELALRGSTRLAYWRLNGPGGEAHLEELGLAAR
ncbi:MAG TPA: hypothetical protein VMT70_19425 [Vicinamibacteria bacterium]|nr:hypothetical protein [Vicinamibacteria bacterium]